MRGHEILVLSPCNERAHGKGNDRKERYHGASNESGVKIRDEQDEQGKEKSARTEKCSGGRGLRFVQGGRGRDRRVFP